MATAKKIIPVKKPTTALVPWEAEMARRAQMQAAAKSAGGFAKSIRFSPAGIVIDDATVPELDCVVLSAFHENQYYDKPYNANNPTSPVCYAFADYYDGGEDVDDMAPHENAENPQGGAEPNVAGANCAGCWANVFGSAEIGRGKACKNIRRLAIITADSVASAEALEEAEIRIAKVPVTSAVNLDEYVINKLGKELVRPMFTTVTRVRAIPDHKSQFKVTFAFEELINFEQDLWDAMRRKVDEAKRLLAQPYMRNDELAAMAPPAPAPRGRPTARPAKAKY